MVERRDALKRGLGASGGKLPNLAEDSIMRDFIAVSGEVECLDKFPYRSITEPEVPA